MTTIGVIGAMQNEIDKLITFYNLKKDKMNKYIYVSELNDKKIVVAMSGVGKVNSAAMTQYIIDKYNTDAIINSGVAGGINNKLKVMDIIISNYVTYHDFMPKTIMESYVPNRGKIEANNTLVDIAKKVVKEMNITNAYFAPMCSGDSFVQDEKLKLEILLNTGACCVDMESASIAHTCALNSIPFISIRTISDMANGGEYFEDIAAYKSSEFVTKLVSEIFLYLSKMSRQEDNIYLYTPKFDELDYYKNILLDPKTMEYNAGYNINLDGYEYETGCVKTFDKAKWYKKQILDKNRFFAYVISKNDNKPIGYVNFHFDELKLKHTCGVIIEYKYRNNGYGSEALQILLKKAFDDYNLNSLSCSIPYKNTKVLKIFTNIGFKDIKEDYYIKRFNNNERYITLEYTKDLYNKKI